MTARGVLLVALAGLILVIACVETLTTIGPGGVVGLELQADSLDLRVGRELRLRVFPVDESGAFRPDVAIAWSSDEPTVVAVNDSGVATGLGLGIATVRARASGLEAVIRVRVEPAPLLSVTRDSVGFAARAGDPDPGPDSVEVQNAGGFVLTGLTVDSIVYGSGAADWLLAALDSTSAPATLTLSPMAAGVTTAGTYLATVEVSAIDAEGSPLGVTASLTISPADPAAASVAEGDAQSAVVNTTVTTAPGVLVEDPFGNVVPGAQVMFAVAGGGGAVSGASATSDAAGIARVGSWRLGMSAGANMLSATVVGAPSIPAVVFTATGMPSSATEIVVAAGDIQAAVAGTMVATPPAVVVRDAFGNGVPGIPVSFAVTSGGGTITGANPTTGASGIAAVASWTLGSGGGSNTLSATVSGVTGSPITFTAIGIGAGWQFALVGGDMQTDTIEATLATPYAVRVTDENGVNVEGVPVSWSVTGEGGSIPTSSATDAAGVARATHVLGPTAGVQTAQAAVGGLSGSPISFTATAQPGNPTTAEVFSGNLQSATVNTAVPNPPAVIVRDRRANGVPGHSVTFAVTAGGGSVNPTSAVTTDAAGLTTATSWTLGTMAGTNNNAVSATATGLSPVMFFASGTPGAPVNVAVAAGNDQTAATGTAVATDPAALVTDQFGNPVGGVVVTFQPTIGGGTVTTATPTTNASGVATVGSWTVRATGSGDAQGRTGNTLQASINSGASTVTFTAFAVYSYAAHVHPIWGSATGNCTGCHGGVSGLMIGGDAASSYAALVGVNPVCDTDGTLVPQGYRRIATGGGTGAEALSILFIFVDPPATRQGDCNGPYMPNAAGLPAATRDTLRAWIRNGAPNN